MTLFEYLSVAVSIVLALGLAHLLGNLQSLFAPGRRYWLHLLHAAQLLLLHALFWWALWSFRDAEWNFVRFLLALSGPALLYACATVLIPTSDPPESWRSHYYRSHRWYFVGQALLLVQVCLMVFALGGPFLLSPTRPLWLLLLVNPIVGALSKNPRVHAGVVALGWLLLSWLSVDQLRPGAVFG
ncbi:MAG: hypothetical protein QNK05_25560 [Myxococcota bacterium]|nr:hypothetical protein [Myxococcota bacterium]